jgi:hypothetical protein
VTTSLCESLVLLLVLLLVLMLLLLVLCAALPHCLEDHSPTGPALRARRATLVRRDDEFIVG